MATLNAFWCATVILLQSADLQNDSDRPSKADISALQGTWIVMDEKLAGHTIDREAKVVFEGDTATFWIEDNAVLKFKYFIDSTKSPKHMDLFLASRKNDTPTKGIYYLMKHDLQIAFTAQALPGTKEAERRRDEASKKRRPAQFESKPGESVYSMVLQRERRCGYGVTIPK